MSKRVNLIISIDTECDKGAKWKVKQPLEFKNITIGLNERLQPLFDRHDIKASYLLSPEIISDQNSKRYFQSIQDRIDLGTHLHSEFIGPQAELDCEITSSFLDDYAESIQYQKLENLTNEFIQAFNKHPISFRAGRYGLAKKTLDYLTELGYQVESSVTPNMWWWRNKSHGVNYLGAPTQPYRPNNSSPRRRGNSSLIEVPISISSSFWQSMPHWLRYCINPINRYQTIAINLLFKRWIKYTWIRPSFSSVEEMLHGSELIINSADSKETVVCMMFHSNETFEDASPYNKTLDDVERFLTTIENYIVEMKKRYDLKSTGLSAMATYKNNLIK